MKNLICLILASLVSLSAVFSQADDHSAGPLFYGHSIGIIASDAPAFLAAMDKWQNSKTGKSTPRTVVLLQNIVNGDHKSTHYVNIFYRNGAAMDASRELVEGDKDWAEFQKTLNSLVEFEWENTYSIVRAKVKEGDVSSANRVSMHTVFTLTDPAGFMTAFDKLWNSSAIQDFPGEVYMGQAIASGMMPGTHTVTFVADSRGKLTEAFVAMQSSKEFAAYMGAAAVTRELNSTSMFSEIKRWSNGS